MRSRHSGRCGGWAATSLVCLAGMVGAACAPRTNLALERAQVSYRQARQDSDIAAYAPVALQESEAVLRQAEQTWESTGDQQEVNHLAYVTERKVEIARATAQENKAEADIQQLGAERAQVPVEARAREAQLAREVASESAARVRQLERELATLRTRQTERGLVLTLDDVLFEFNKTELKPGAMHDLYPLVTFLKENPARSVLIEGYTDSIGPDSYNLELSQRRAEAVRSFLVRNGIDPARITARGYGKAYPVTSNETEAGRQQNRRVEVVVLREGELASRWMR